MNKYILLAVAAMITGGVAAQSEQLSYKGLPLGTTLQAFQAKLPDYQCRTENYCSYDLKSCNGRLVGISQEAIDAHSQNFRACNERTSFGGALTTSAFAYFKDGALANLDLTIPSDYMASLADTVTQKYGQATELNEEPFRNRAGAQFSNWKKSWKIGEEYLFLTLRSGRVDEGSAQLTSKSQMEAVLQERKKKTQMGTKDF